MTAPTGASGTQILIVHNVEYILMSLARVLEDQGYSTAAAVDYEQTLRLLSDSRFDALILDDQLSDRDSIQAVGDLRAPWSAAAVGCRRVSPTAATRRASMRAAVRVKGFISKPAHDELTHTVRAMLRPR